MPVSHLGLTVSHIPSATSFYLSALQPLGYRYIGHQGDSIGLGVETADFFLTQSPVGTRPSPNHIAFLAESRLIVRECYAAALNSGGQPSGSPDYRNADCSCFNAAVEDLDGNTIEFIFRQPHGPGGCPGAVASSEKSNVMTWQKDVAENTSQDGAELPIKSAGRREAIASKVSRAKSRTQTALELVSNTSKSTKSEMPAPGISRSSTAPAKSDFPGKTLIGTALGAAAGAVLIYALTRSEGENAKEEADHLASITSRAKSSHSPDDSRPLPVGPEVSPSSIPSEHAPQTGFRRSRRNFSTTESAYSRPMRSPTKAMRMIESGGYNKEVGDVQEALGRYNNMRPQPTRSHTYDEVEYAPICKSSRPEAPAGYVIVKQAATPPVDPAEFVRPDYYIEASPPAKNSTSRHANRRDSASQTSHHSHSHSHRRRSYDDEANIKRHDSGISMRSSRSRRDQDSESSRRSSASTIKPSRRDSAYEKVVAAVPYHPAASKAPSSCYFPAAISLPPSQASSRITAIENPAAPPPLDAVASKQSWEDFTGEESDGLGDIKTVVPDDSISCVDLSKPRRRRRGSHGSGSHHSHRSQRSSRRSDSTVKPARKEREREWDVDLPVRSRAI